MSPVCESGQTMSNDAFAMADLEANNIRRQAQSLLPKLQLLGACHSFETLPEGSLKLAASRLREAADYLEEVAGEAAKTRDDLADRFPQPRILEAAE